MPVASGAPVTSNETQQTQAAAGVFSDLVGTLTTIIGNVFDAGNSLATDAMVSTAGRTFNGGIGQWVEDFEDIRDCAKWMSEQLTDTANAMAAGNWNNAEVAAQMPKMGGFGF